MSSARRTAIICVVSGGVALGLAATGSLGAQSDAEIARGEAGVLFGTNSADTLTATDGIQFVFGKGGADNLTQADSAATVFPGPDSDLAVGNQTIDQDGDRRDVLRGTDGLDLLISADGSRDIVRCGANPDDPSNPFNMKDIAVVDGKDVLADCEVQLFANATVFLPNGIGGPLSFVFGDNSAETLSTLEVGDATWLFGKGGDDSLRNPLDVAALFWPGPGSDEVVGGAANERIFDDDGGPWTDRLKGGPGNDLIVSADGRRDVIRCGTDSEDGGDTAVADRRDVLSGCEDVRQN